MHTLPINKLDCDYSNAFILVKENITVNNTTAVAAANNTNKKVIFKSCSPFTNCISKTNTEVDNAERIDIVIPMHNLIEYSDNYYGDIVRKYQL